MAEFGEKCSVCQALLDEEDLFCANCGTEAPRHDQAERPTAALTSTYNFECAGCGASMSYDASAQALRCPFCGSERLEPRRDAQVLSPRRVVPFALDRAQADRILRSWLGNSFWRPSDLSRRAVVDAMRPVYVPYWVFSGHTFTYWTADTSQVPFGASGNWFPMTGEHRGHYQGLLISASSVLTPAETNALAPFDLSTGVTPDQIDLNHAIYEQFRVQRKYARPLAQTGLDELERKACSQYVPAQCRNLHVNVRVEALTSEPVMLPVWVVAYRYQGQVYRFLINGQTGQATGEAPTDWKKILLVAGAIVLALLLLFLLFGAIAAVAAEPERASALRAARAGLVYSAPSQQLFTPSTDRVFLLSPHGPRSDSAQRLARGRKRPALAAAAHGRHGRPARRSRAATYRRRRSEKTG